MKKIMKISVAVVFALTLVGNLVVDSKGSFSFISVASAADSTTGTTAAPKYTAGHGDCYKVVNGHYVANGQSTHCISSSSGSTDCTNVTCGT